MSQLSEQQERLPPGPRYGLPSNSIKCLEQADSDWDNWDELANKCVDGKAAHVSSEKCRKRKGASSSSKSRKNYIRWSDSDDGSGNSVLDSDGDEENNPDNENQWPITKSRRQRSIS
ncbi:uncharacterized protein LY79DRAFT_568441 [Colletotrichum navitas]|uniref:Uncharacterized protein n=1 Tax=Colletotrichum navitas TaxID=681940 RepID=A0AAD8PPP7_9PEZI|nr:uncharacterized protein LY79DRAFT_568441 [Colletotrichum navitas]KAK1573485.1 hypothetical protein LY79DRAFT_568441 [Colletotrichum navitas]